METLSDLRRRVGTLRGRRWRTWVAANALIALSRVLTALARAGHKIGLLTAASGQRIVERALLLTQQAHDMWAAYMAERDAVKRVMVMRLASPRRSRGWRR